MIQSLSQLDLSQRYTYADYLAWQFTERVELIKGYIRKMSAPNIRHQGISGEMFLQMKLHFQKQSCRVFHAPFDVRLYNRRKSLLQEKDAYTVVQPDLCVVCDLAKLADGKGCNGAPEWIIEILSPSTADLDTKEKLQLYEEAGVAEYWIVFPNEQLVQQYVLEGERYRYRAVYTETQSAVSALFPDLSMDLAEVFKP